MGTGDQTPGLVSFMDNATMSIRSALHRPTRQRRKVNHRKYLQKQLTVHRLNTEPTTISKQRQEKSLDELFHRNQSDGNVGGGNRQVNGVSLRQRKLPLSFFVEPRSCSPSVSSPCSFGSGDSTDSNNFDSDSLDLVTSLMELDTLLNSQQSIDDTTRIDLQQQQQQFQLHQQQPQHLDCTLQQYPSWFQQQQQQLQQTHQQNQQYQQQSWQPEDDSLTSQWQMINGRLVQTMHTSFLDSCLTTIDNNTQDYSYNNRSSCIYGQESAGFSSFSNNSQQYF